METYFYYEKVQRTMHNCIIPPYNIWFFPEFFGHVGEWIDEKAKVNFKTFDATDWETNNYNTNIA